MSVKVCILDYGCGNVKSVYNAFISLTDEVTISNDNAVIRASTHIVLPGVGAFASSMEKVRERIDIKALEEEVLLRKKPFLGICVGMQILADKGYEFGEHEGLGWIEGEVVKLETRGLSLPHIGWNNISRMRGSGLLERFKENQDFYFVHSYVFKEKRECDAVARTVYGNEFTSVVGKDNIFGVQFHPEKSQKAGSVLIGNFLRLS